MYNSSSSMCLNRQKTPISVQKFVKKSEKAFPGNSASKAHLNIEIHLPCSTPTPNRWRSKLQKGLPSTQQFLMASLRLKQDAS